jgi:hypothetical protein
MALPRIFMRGNSVQWVVSASNLEYWVYGIYNNNPGGSYGAFCPANGYTNNNYVDPLAVTVIYSDLSPALPVQCFVTATNWDGGAFWGETLFSCPAAGGCTFEPDSRNFTGLGDLTFTSPVFYQGTPYALNVAIECIIPDHSTLYGYSMTLP